MTRVQNWRDYLKDDTYKKKVKFSKKKKLDGDDKEYNKRTGKNRSKRK